MTAAAVQPLHYTACGLPDVWLMNGFARHDTPDGPGFSIIDADGLHAALARFIVTGKRLMTPAELRFVRKHMNLSQAGLARLIGVTDQTIARWEKAESEMDPAAQRLIRFIVLEQLGNDFVVLEELRALAEQDEELHGDRHLERRGDAWLRAA